MEHFDIRNRDMEKKISFKYLWMKEMYEKIRLMISPEELTNKELQEYLMKVYDQRYQPVGRFMNNISRTNKKMSLESFINWYINSDYILSGYCCLFKNHDSKNIAANALKYILDQRKYYKKKMAEYEYGSDMYIYYNVMQLTYKVLANSYYGILGQSTSPFYNSHIQNSVTLSGQDVITTSITANEGFLGNNCKFNDVNDCIEFINNIKNDKYQFDILQYIDTPIDSEKLSEYLYGRFKSEISDESKQLVRSISDKLDDDIRSRVYYKCNLIKLLENSYFVNEMRTKIHADGGYKNDQEFCKLVCDFTHYDHILEDRYNRVLKDSKNTVIGCDTDSNFLYLDTLVQNCMRILGEDRTLENEMVNMFIDFSVEGVRRSFWTLTTNFGIEDDFKEIINMKNEFNYERFLTTKNKKNYAAVMKSKLGKVINLPIEDRIDIKGLAIRKSTITKDLRESFTDFLVHNILEPDEVNLGDINEGYDKIRDKVANSIANGETTYAVPLNLSVPDSYANPDRQQAVRGYIVWNDLEPDKAIQPPEKINSFKLKSGYPFSRATKKIKAKDWNKDIIKADDWTSECEGKYEVISVDKNGNRVVKADFDSRYETVKRTISKSEYQESLRRIGSANKDGYVFNGYTVVETIDGGDKVILDIDENGTRNVYIETLDEAYVRFESELYQTPEFKQLKDNYPDKYNIIMRSVYNKGVKKMPKIHFEDKGFNTIAIPKDVDVIPEYLIPFIDQNEMIKINTSAGNILIGSLGIYCDDDNNKTNILKL